MTILLGDARERLKDLPDESVQCCITSPPYFNLRDYGVDGQVGQELTPSAYVEALVGVFREVRRVLRKDGTLWLNLGDSFAANRSYQVTDTKHRDVGNTRGMRVPDGLKEKDLLGIPWLAAFGLRDDGWYLRSDIIWSKPSPMPESVKDRPTRAHEYLFLLSKSARYFYDAEAIAEPVVKGAASSTFTTGKTGINGLGRVSLNDREERTHRNRRSVWTVPTQPFAGAHFATFPEKLVEPCVLAGCPEGGVVLDPFFGSGTVGKVCNRLGRRWIGIEINPNYAAIAEQRTAQQGFGALLGETAL